MMSKESTKCWECAKACGGCCWSDHWQHTPVPGWIATETTVRLKKDMFEKSYLVIDCPEFIRDGTGGGLYRVRSG